MLLHFHYLLSFMCILTVNRSKYSYDGRLDMIFNQSSFRNSINLNFQFTKLNFIYYVQILEIDNYFQNCQH
jgi:hypothetical protein